MFKEIIVTEVLQCGDNFLFKHPCPICSEETLVGAFTDECGVCRFKFEKIFYTLPQTKSSWRLITGTRRKKTINKKMVLNLLEMQCHQCAYCGINLRIETYEVEHIVPLCAGGTNNISNLVLSCVRCNRIAASKVFKTFLDKRSYILNRREALE